MSDTAVASLLSIWALVIAGTDFRQLRVPNSLLLVVFVPAVLYQLLAAAGILGLSSADAVIGMGIGLALGLPGYALNQFGAGDVKYLAVLGVLCGPGGIVAILLTSALILGVMAVGFALRAKARQRKSARMPAAIALSSGFILLLFLSGRLDYGL